MLQNNVKMKIQSQTKYIYIRKQLSIMKAIVRRQRVEIKVCGTKKNNLKDKCK